ncbi:sulfur carrier protein ThiS [Corallincola platygyrae]|uniref:Sulfur carrier protein ThiS n=1 Tax=Corallincola platygyrae TaxID=1193278 RepID=A0ABW4XTW7_9GAMM
MTQVFVNGEAVDCPIGATVAELLRLQQFDTLGIAVAVNQQIIPRGQWHLHELAHQDHIQLFKAIAGG